MLTNMVFLLDVCFKWREETKVASFLLCHIAQNQTSGTDHHNQSVRYCCRCHRFGCKGISTQQRERFALFVRYLRRHHRGKRRNFGMYAGVNYTNSNHHDTHLCLTSFVSWTLLLAWCAHRSSRSVHMYFSISFAIFSGRKLSTTQIPFPSSSFWLRSPQIFSAWPWSPAISSKNRRALLANVGMVTDGPRILR